MNPYGTRPTLLPPLPPAVRYLLIGCVLGALVYVMAAADAPVPKHKETIARTEFVVPELDRTLLATADDSTHEQRLLLETEPLRHLLAKSIDVGPSVAAALGTPEEMVPLATLRADPTKWRGRWLWYEGKLERLAAAREGHPVKGYGIHEATVRLADGDAVQAAFSMAPDPAIAVGGWVRVEGFLLKLFDANYPAQLERAPFLVGRAIQRDYEDWGPVRQLDQALLATVDDSSFMRSALMWRTLDEDQSEPLWHLGAYARDTATDRTLADWRNIATLNWNDQHRKLMDGQIARGTPMRVFGTLIQRKTIAAPANPAGIKFWTQALIQVREYGGIVVPVWVPQRARELPDRAPLEVRAFYYRWYAFETLDNKERRAPLFVAADLDVYELHVGNTMQHIGIWLGSIVVVLLSLLWWSQRRAARSALAHARDMDARRRRRREHSRQDGHDGGT